MRIYRITRNGNVRIGDGHRLAAMRGYDTLSGFGDKITKLEYVDIPEEAWETYVQGSEAPPDS